MRKGGAPGCGINKGMAKAQIRPRFLVRLVALATEELLGITPRAICYGVRADREVKETKGAKAVS